jgi:hypothetical protein
MLVAVCIAVSLARPSLAATVPFWGARDSRPADTVIDTLRHGDFIWLGDTPNVGPMLMVVSLAEQRAYVYRNGVLIGITTVSTGRKGHETPTGVFTILQKDRDHVSSIYDAAPMPYMERLTWGGVALHAGGLPGYPESHGCVHLPSEFARRLFAISETGMTVVIAAGADVPSAVAHPSFLTPIDSRGQALPDRTLRPEEVMRWQPERASSGPVSIVLSRRSERIVVYRDGVEIGRSRVSIRGDEPLGTHLLTLVRGPAAAAEQFVPDRSNEHWVQVGVAGHLQDAGLQPSKLAEARVGIPPAFVKNVMSILSPGATVLVTDAPITSASSGSRLNIVNADTRNSDRPSTL